MAKAKFKTKKNNVKIADLLQELNMSEGQLNALLKEVGIRTVEGQKNLDQQEVARIRAHLNEQKRREELKQKTLKLPSIVSVQQLAETLELPVGDVLSTLLKNGVLANINDELDYETAAIIAEELGYKTEEDVGALEERALSAEALDEILKKEDGSKQESRAPVVTILGHVDHGKTTLLDNLRSANVAEQEAGGITQAISSYQVQKNDRAITFIDTPGHETFDFMRQRGASLADIAVLVVAADDGVKPQTKDAAQYIKDQEIPVVVAINKVDKPEANVDKVKTELSELGLMPEEWGGETTMVEVSALKQQGLDELLDMILLTTDIVQPKAVFDRNALGTVIESRLDKNLGPLAAVLIHTGTLHTGEYVVVGQQSGRVRRILDFRGKDIGEAKPSMPVTIVGLDGVPQAGDILQSEEDKGQALEKASQRRAPLKHMTKADESDTRETLALVLKADSQGSLEAIEQTIRAMVPEDEVRLSIIRSEVGNISDSDVLTAKAADAIIYGFNTRVAGMSQKLADKEDVPVKLFDVIYRLSEDVRGEIEQRLPVDVHREELGRIKVLKVFFSAQTKNIVGGEVAEGKIEPDAQIIAWRREKTKKGEQKEEARQAATGEITELQRERQDIKQASQGDQIGLTVEGKGKIKEGDVLEVFKEEKIRRSLEQ